MSANPTSPRSSPRSSTSRRPPARPVAGPGDGVRAKAVLGERTTLPRPEPAVVAPDAGHRVAELERLLVAAHEQLFARDETCRLSHVTRSFEPPVDAELEHLRSLVAAIRRTRVWRSATFFWRIEARLKRLFGRPTHNWPPP